MDIICPKTSSNAWPDFREGLQRGILQVINYQYLEKIHQTLLSSPVSFCNTEDDIYGAAGIMNKFQEA